MNAKMLCVEAEDQERRVYYRLHYTVHTCPLFRLNGHRQNVLDISTTGIRFSPNSGDRLHLGERLQAAVHFRNGDLQTISGTVIRIGAEDAAAWLEQGFGVDVIVRERQRLMSLLKAHSQ